MSKQPLTPIEQLRNLCDALCADELVNNKPLTKREREDAERLRSRLISFVEEYEKRANEAPAPEWAKKAAAKKNAANQGNQK